MAAAKKGSEKMKIERGFDDAKVKAVIAKLRKLKLNPDIIINGQPRPDFISGTLKAADVTKFAEGLKTVFEFGPAQYNFHNILTRGIPIPDDLLVRFEVTAR
jgi:hypothetical protein